jgi:zinc transport system substrate-binding protein
LQSSQFEGALLAKARRMRPALAEYPVHQSVPRLGGAPHHHHDGQADDGDCRAAAGADPHIWLAPRNMAILATNTCRFLQQLLPGRQEGMARSLAQLTASLVTLETDLAATLAPAAGGTFWVYHPSWAYFAAAFKLRQQAVEQEGREPSGRQLARLIETAREARARVLFADPQFDPGPIRTLARQLGARVVVLDPLNEAWAKNMRHVAEAIRDALQEFPDEPR